MNGVTVLLVIEDQASREGLSRLLAGAGGFDVVGKVGNGADAVDLAVTLSPEVILIDAQMSGTSGIAATRILKKERTYPGAVIVLSVDTEDLEDALESGAVGYLLKDALPDELTAVVRGATDGGFVFGNSVMQTARGMEIALRYFENPTLGATEVPPDNTAEQEAGAEEAVESTPAPGVARDVPDDGAVGPDETDEQATRVGVRSPDRVMMEVELVIAGPPTPAQVLKLYQNLKGVTDIVIDEVAGSWTGDTVMKLTLRRPIPLLPVLADLPGVVEVTEEARVEGETTIRRPGILGQTRDVPPPPRLRVVLEDA